MAKSLNKSDRDHSIEDFSAGRVVDIRKRQTIFTKDDTPAVVLWNPKYAHNVGGVVRACSCFNSGLVLFSGDCILEDLKKGYRLPREARMRKYEDVRILRDDYPLTRFGPDVTPVAVEVRPNAEVLTDFEHPENPVYIFGPEDGSLPQSVLSKCHRFVVIPTNHCVNLAAAAYLVLYDRASKRGYRREKGKALPL